MPVLILCLFASATAFLVGRSLVLEDLAHLGRPRWYSLGIRNLAAAYLIVTPTLVLIQ